MNFEHKPLEAASPLDPPTVIQFFRIGTEAKDWNTGVFYRYEKNSDGLFQWVVSEHVTVSRAALQRLVAACVVAIPLLDDYVQGRPEAAEELRNALLLIKATIS